MAEEPALAGPSVPDAISSQTELSALERSLAEIERLSKACTDAAAGNWGGRPVPPGEVREEAPTDQPRP